MQKVILTIKIVFRQERTPIKAWYNASRQAQAYRWRPDQIFPSIERNLKLIKDGFSPTAYLFVSGLLLVLMITGLMMATFIHDFTQ
jgi:hypothetical protein